MKQLILSLFSILILFSNPAHSKGVDVQIKASLDFVELIDGVASWVQGAITRYDNHELKRIKESVPKLVKQLSTLAGEKSALANHLNSFKSGADKTQFTKNYRNKVNGLNKQLAEIRKTIETLDPEWAGSNPLESFNASNAVAQKTLFLQNDEIHDKLFETNLIKLANAYNRESYNLLLSSIEISNTLKGHNE